MGAKKSDKARKRDQEAKNLYNKIARVTNEIRDVDQKLRSEKQKLKRCNISTDPPVIKKQRMNTKSTLVNLNSSVAIESGNDDISQDDDFVQTNLKNITWSHVVDDFKKEINQHASYVCLCCGGLFYKKAVVNIDKSYSSFITFLDLEYFPLEIVNGTKYVCRTCFIDIKNNTLPRLSLKNGLRFPQVPVQLNDLTALEERLVALRIPFMQIKSRNYAGSKYLKGNIVNVPSNLDLHTSKIPRQFSKELLGVMLVRRMCHAHAYMFENVRTRKLVEAAKVLCTTPLYMKAKVTCYDDWDMKEMSQHVDVYETKKNETEHILENSDNSESEDEDETTNAETVMIQNDEWMDMAIKIAPGQGSTPLSLLLDNNAEELSFPSVYCGQPRILLNPKITYTDIVKSEVRRYDRRATKPVILLYKYRKLIYEKVLTQINICLRKKKKKLGEKLTAQDVLTKEGIQRLVEHDDGFRILQNIRSSPPYWEAQKKKVLAMIRQLGQPTFFITLSAAETKWEELLTRLYMIKHNKSPAIDEIKNMKFVDKMDLINEDPVTCVQYYNNRFQSLLNILIKNKAGIFNPFNAQDYYWRYEFQHRGSVHTHMILWVENSPKFDHKTQSGIIDCIKFIDTFITTERLADEDEMASFSQYQLHKHSFTCRKNLNGKRKCRFNFPRPPLPMTTILFPLKCSSTIRKQHEFNYERIQLFLQSLGRNYKDAKSFDWLLEELELTAENYENALCSSLKRPFIFLKRDVNAAYVNSYNKKLLSAWEANMDIQFILNPYSCATYVCNYISKADGGISKLLRDVDKEVKLGNYALRERLRKIGNVFNNFSEISQQEAAIGCLGIDIVGCSIGDIFINTSLEHERVRLLKSKEELNALPKDSEEILADNVIERYIKRPKVLDNTTLATFGTKYRYVKGNTCSAKQISIHGGYLVSRNRHLILRYRRYGEAADPTNYHREMLMLFYPWRNEAIDILQNCSQKYYTDSILAQIEEEKKLYHSSAFGSDVEAVDIPEESIELETLENDAFYEDFCCDVLQDLGVDRTNRNIKQILLPKLIDDKQYRQTILGLNSTQRKILLDCIHRIRTGQIPFYKFISGGAGVGKTHLIKILVQVILRICYKQHGINLNDVFVLVCAPTGKAAFNVMGMTLHHTFRLPPGKYVGNLSQLDSSTINSLRIKFKHLKVIFIDEVSMVPSKNLHHLSTRLQQIFECNKPFGGISVIVVGHYRQLPPIPPIYCFQPLNKPLSGISTQLWDEFHLNELTEIMRQRDKRFCTALNNLAEDCLTEDDIALFKSREIGPHTGLTAPPGAQYLFYLNDDCNEHNKMVHSKLDGEKFVSYAIDRVQSSFKISLEEEKKALAYAKTLKRTENDGLQNEVTLVENAKYSVTTNIDVEDGLFNGAMGILKRIIKGQTKSGSTIPPRIQIYFQNPVVGAKQRGNILPLHCEDNPQCWTTINPFTRVLQQVGRNTRIQVVRTQIPVKPADAVTIHYSQGSDLYGYVLCLKHLTRQLLYTGCSRAPTLEDLFLLGSFKNPSPIPANDIVTIEMDRLRSLNNGWNLKFLQDEEYTSCNKLIFLNIQSFLAHVDEIQADECFMVADLLVFVEPHIQDSDTFQLYGFDQCFRSTSNCRQKSKGVLIYKRSDSNLQCNIIPHKMDNSQLELIVIQTQALRIIGIYKPPKYPDKSLIAILKTYLDTAIPTVVIGDFNIDFFQPNCISKLMSEHNYYKVTENFPSTSAGTQIDVCFANCDCFAWYYESIFTYHQPICMTWNSDCTILSEEEISSINQKNQTIADVKPDSQKTKLGHCEQELVQNLKSISLTSKQIDNKPVENYSELKTFNAEHLLNASVYDVSHCDDLFKAVCNQGTTEVLQYLKTVLSTQPVCNYKDNVLDTTSMNQLPKSFTKFWKPVETEADGNCFYRAVSLGMYGNEDHHLTIRLAVFLELLFHQEEYVNICITRHSVTPFEDYMELLQDSKQIGAWAGEIHTLVAAKILQRPIYTYQFMPDELNYDENQLLDFMANSPNPRFRQAIYSNVNADREPICLHFRGESIGKYANHFVALLPVVAATRFPCNYNEYVLLLQP